MANMLMMRYAAMRGAEHDETMRRPEREEERQTTESRYRGKGGRWETGTMRSEYENDHESEEEMRPSNVVAFPYSTPERKIGFGATNRMDDEMHETEHHNGMHTMHTYEDDEEMGKFDRYVAEKWVKSMEPEDRKQPIGGKWTPEMIKPIAQKYGIPTNGDRFWEFYAVMNSIYSDTSEIAKEYGITTPDYYAKLAMVWLNDRDAVPNKAAMYYKYIVKH